MDGSSMERERESEFSGELKNEGRDEIKMREIEIERERRRFERVRKNFEFDPLASWESGEC